MLHSHSYKQGASQYTSDVLGRMLGSAQSCGVLRTCCRVAPDVQVPLASQQFGIGGPQSSEVFQMPFPGHHQPPPQHHFQPQPPHRFQQKPFQSGLPFLRPNGFRKPILPSLGSFEITGASLFKPKLPFQRPPSGHPFGPQIPQGFLGNQFGQATQFGKPYDKPFHGGPHGISQSPHIQRPVNPLISLPVPFRPHQPRPVSGPITSPLHPYPSSSFVSPANHIGNVRPSYGTCGARNAVGIHGRVQNLQYHESSTEFGEYPWQVAILKRIGPADSLYVCGAAMITSEWVITAAHCIKKNTAADLKVRFGEWDVSIQILHSCNIYLTNS